MKSRFGRSDDLPSYERRRFNKALRIKCALTALFIACPSFVLIQQSYNWPLAIVATLAIFLMAYGIYRIFKKPRKVMRGK